MRAVMVFAALAGCTPEIVTGAYLCGPEESCPEGQTCSGDGLCVTSGREIAFSCEASLESSEPDQTPAAMATIAVANCATPPVVRRGCLARGDAADWVKFSVPAGCSSTVKVNVGFPVAWEPLAIELFDVAGNASVATAKTCDSAAPNEDAACLSLPVTASKTYAIGVSPAGGGDCDGRCGYNRYRLEVQLTQ